MIRLVPAFVAAVAFAQTPPKAPAQKPAFDVASIRSAPMPTPRDIMMGHAHIGMKVDAARVDIGSMPMAELLRIAYRVKPYQISGPGWISTERFDVMATIPSGVSTDQVPEMLQSLLADRFRLQAHRETKEHPVYALVVAKNGPKLKASHPEAPAAAPAPAPGATFTGPDGNQMHIAPRPGGGRGMVITGGRGGTMQISPGPSGTMHLEASEMRLADLADMLSRFVDRPVVDMTGLQGSYQMAFDFSIADLRTVARSMGMGMAMRPAAARATPSEPADTASDPSGSSIFAAVQQLGLKLEPRKVPLEQIVVDHLEKTPTEN